MRGQEFCECRVDDVNARQLATSCQANADRVTGNKQSQAESQLKPWTLTLEGQKSSCVEGEDVFNLFPDEKIFTSKVSGAVEAKHFGCSVIVPSGRRCSIVAIMQVLSLLLIQMR